MAAQNASIVWPAIFAGRAYQSAFNSTFNVLPNARKFGRVIPDFVARNGILELKAGRYVHYSSQILGEMELATGAEVPYFLAVSPQTTIASTTLGIAAYDESSEVSAAFWEMIAAAIVEE
jgi:hypothetical protein